MLSFLRIRSVPFALRQSGLLVAYRILALPCPPGAWLILLLVAVLTTGTTLAQTIRYVKPTASGTGDGRSWANATADLQGAINASSAGDQVWVAAGTYNPGGIANVSTGGSPVSNQALAFSMKDRVTIYGGFSGNETNVSQRPAVDPLAGQPSASILTGNLGYVNPQSGGRINFQSFHVFFNPQGLTTGSVLDGFVITQGDASNDLANNPQKSGGGMYNEGSSPTLRNLVFQDNSGLLGGGLSNVSSNPVLMNCLFQRNFASSFSDGGAAIRNNNSTVRLENCLLQANRSGGAGGGIYNVGSSNLDVIQCTIQNNDANSGGAIANSGSSLRLYRSILATNRAVFEGGALANTGSVSSVVTNCLLQDNSAPKGAGVYNRGSSATLTNCTLRRNLASISFDPNFYPGPGAVFNENDASANLNSCIVFGNWSVYSVVGECQTRPGQPPVPCNVPATSYTFSVNVTLRYTMVDDTTARQATYTDAGGNLTTHNSPFVSSEDSRLNDCTSAINAGDPNSASLIATVGLRDLANESRFYNGGRIDMGAYEFQGISAFTTDTQPLTDLYNATGGANWTRKDNWLTGCTPCNWYGVTCTNGRVTGVNLIGNNLIGTLPASLSALTSLQSLELGANALTGGIPTGISNLTALQTLNLSRTQLGGTIPAGLGQLTRLQNLLLNESALTGSLPASLGNLSQLQNLQLYSNQLSGCFPGSYTSLCGKNVSFAGNPNLPGGGNFAAFCSDGTGGPLVVSQGPQSGTACTGSAFSFSVVARGAASYQWYKLGPAQGQFQLLAETGPVLSFSSVSASDGGNYQVVINYSCGNGALQSDVVTLTVPQPGSGGCPQVNTPPVATVNPSQTATVGTAFAYTVNAFTDAQTPNSLTYSASLNPANGLSFDPATRLISGTATVAGPISVTVTATDPGGLSASTSFTIAVQPAPVVAVPLALTLTASPATLLTTGTATLSATVSGGTSPYRYSFSGPGTITPNGNTATVSGLPTGVQTFTVLVTDASSPTPQTVSATVSVTVSAPSTFTASLSASPSTTLTCAQTSLTLTAGGTNDEPGISYAFSPNVTSQRGNTAVVNAAGVYSVTVTSTSSGYASIASINIYQDASAPTATLSASPSSTLTCAQTSLTLTASGGNAYAFSPNVASQNGNTAVVNTAGVYSVRVTNTATGCFSTTSITVYQDAIAPTVSITPSSATLTCASPSVSLTAVGVGNVLWSTGSTERVITVNTAGTYSMTIINGNGCSASASVTVGGDQNVPSVSINPSSVTLTCASPTVSLTAVGVGNVLWSTGSAERIITVNTAGIYSVTITNGNGCSASASVIIGGDQSAPTVSITGSLTVVPGGTTTLTASGGGSYRWSTGQTTPGISATAGTYSVTATTANGCFATASATVSTGALANTAPTVANPVSPQSATVGVGYTLSVANTFTDAQTPSSLSLMVAGLPANLSLSGTTISGSPSTTVGSPYSVTLTARDPGGLSGSTVFTLSVSPAVSMTTVPTAPLAITGVTTIDCTPVANRVNLSFNPQYAGLNGTPVSFSVANELAPTTDGGPYTLSLYADNPVITLRAVQSGVSSSFTYNWLTACNSQSATPGGNTAPTVANAIPPQSATVGQGFSYVIPVSTFTDAQTPNSLVLSVAGLPAGLNFTAPATISGSASGSGVSMVTVTATDPGNLSMSTTVTITVRPASMTTTPPGVFALTGVTTVSCTPVGNRVNLSFTPQYAGLTGSGVRFEVVNELAPTTDGGPYSLSLYADNPVITLRAVQSGVSSSFAYNWLAACSSLSATPGNTAPTVANTIPPQSATVGVGFSYLIPANTFTDAQTPTALVLSATGLPAGLNLVGTTISGVPSMSGVSTVTVTAIDPGNLSVSTTVTITVSPASMTTTPIGTFSITGVTGVSCQTLSAGLRRLTFSPVYSGLNGQAVSFGVVNELGTTTAPGPYSLNLYTDNPVITLKASQAGSAGASSFAYSWLSSCPAFVASGRLGSAEESGSGLRVTVLGNPVTGESIELEIRGAAGKAVTLRLVDLQGKLQHQQQIHAANSLERVSLPVSSRGGLFLLHVQTAQAQQQLKLIIN